MAAGGALLRKAVLASIAVLFSAIPAGSFGGFPMRPPFVTGCVRSAVMAAGSHGGLGGKLACARVRPLQKSSATVNCLRMSAPLDLKFPHGLIRNGPGDFRKGGTLVGDEGSIQGGAGEDVGGLALTEDCVHVWVVEALPLDELEPGVRKAMGEILNQVPLRRERGSASYCSIAVFCTGIRQIPLFL
jgi:hypothetical protein